MADGQHNPSRRALLGATVGLPLIGAVGAEEAPPPSFAIGCGGSPSPANAGEEWEKALAAFEAAQAAVWEIEAATAGGSAEEEEALLPAHEAACEAMEAALQRMLFVPAPHLLALGIKFEAAFADELTSAVLNGELRFPAIMQDIIRLHGAQRGSRPRRQGPSRS
jgi:hypothetical protein